MKRLLSFVMCALFVSAPLAAGPVKLMDAAVIAPLGSVVGLVAGLPLGVGMGLVSALNKEQPAQLAIGVGAGLLSSMTSLVILAGNIVGYVPFVVYAGLTSDSDPAHRNVISTKTIQIMMPFVILVDGVKGLQNRPGELFNWGLFGL